MKKILSLLIASSFLCFHFSLFAQASSVNTKSASKTEHLILSKKQAKKTPTDVVITSPTYSSVIEYNTIELTFAEYFSTKTAKVGDEVNFMLPKGLNTNEGTSVLPEGSIFVAKVTNIEAPKSFNRTGKVNLEFTHIVLPDGTNIPIEAKLFGNKDYLSRGKLNALGKGMGTTLGTAAVGIGAGCGIGVAAGAVIIGGFAIGLPVGFAVGAIAGLCTPGLHYKAKPGDKIVIQLTENLDIKK